MFDGLAKAIGIWRRHETVDVQALALLSATAIDRVGLFVIHALLARLLTTEQFAGFVLAYAIASIATRVGDGGLSIASIRMLAHTPSDAPEVVGTSGALRVSLLILAGALTLLVGVLLEYVASLIQTAVILTIALSIAGLAQLTLTPLRAARRLDKEALANVAGTVARLSCFAGYVVYGLSDGLSIVGVAVALLIGSLIHLAVAIATCGRFVGSFRPRYRHRRAGLVIAQSWPLAMAVLFIMGQSRVGVLLLEELASPTSVALFGAALTLIAGLAILPDSLSSAIYPRLCAVFQTEGVLRFRKLMLAAGSVNAVLGMLVTASMLLFAEPVLAIIFGPTYVSASPALKVLAVSFVFGAVASVGGDSLNALGRPSLNMICVAIGLTATTVATVLLVPVHGIVGAALGHLIGIASIAVGTWFSALLIARRARHRESAPAPSPSAVAVDRPS